MTAKDLKNAILQEAIQGKLVPQNTQNFNTDTQNCHPELVSGSHLLKQIKKQKDALIKDGKLKKEKPLPPITDEEKPFEIPENWCWCRLGEICTKLVDGDHNPPAGINNKTDYIMASSRNINDDKLVDLDCVRYLTEDVFNKENERTKVSKGDILFTSVGTLGRSCIYNEDFNICFQRSVSVITTAINNKYLKFVLDNPYVQNFIIENATGTAQKGFYLNQLSQLIIPLPPLEEQKRIVDAIEQLLPLVNEYGKANQELDLINKNIAGLTKKAILQEAVQGKLVPQNKTEGSGNDLLKQIKNEMLKQVQHDGKLKKEKPLPPITDEEKPFELPENWCWCRLGEICEIYTGNSINETEKKLFYSNLKVGFNYIGTKDVSFEQKIDYENGVKIPFEAQKNKFRLAPYNSILMCIEGGSAGRKIAKVNQDVCFGNKLCCFNSYNKENAYLYYYLQSSNFTDIFKSNISGIIGGVSINKLKELLLPLPPLSEQKRIVDAIEQLLPLVEKLGKS